jgi:hypothetical protein
MFKKIAAIALVAAMTPVAFAGPEAGDSEVSIFGNLSYSDGGDTLYMQGTYGYYFTDAINVGFTYGFLESGGVDASTFGLQGEYNFGGEDMVPFLFATYVSVDYGFGTADGYGIGGGAKFYMNENAGFKITAAMNSFENFDTTDIAFGMFYNF